MNTMMAKAAPLNQQIQKYRESTIIEIHGGSPQSIDHLRTVCHHLMNCLSRFSKSC